jgi:hypothetical protein
VRSSDRKLIWEVGGDMVSSFDLLADPEEFAPGEVC